MEMVGLGAVLAAVGGALLWDLGTQRRHVQRVRAAWERAGQTVQAGPVGTIAEGDRLIAAPLRRAFGALAIVDGQMRFVGHRTAALDIAVPLEAVRWIGMRARVKTAWNRRIETPELVIHAETPDGWCVFCFLEGALPSLAEQIGALTGLSVEVRGEVREDFGPTPAVWVEPDAASGWCLAGVDQPDPRIAPAAWLQTARLLYLAPDRLLFDRRQAILLERIRRVTAIAAGAGDVENPFGVSLLRVDYESEAGERRVSGYVVPNAGDWAGVLEARAGIRAEWREVAIDK